MAPTECAGHGRLAWLAELDLPHGIARAMAGSAAASHLITLRGLRRGEAAGLRWCDLDLVVPRLN